MPSKERGIRDININEVFVVYFCFIRNIYERSKWCAIFTVEDLMILEYGQDLKSYYKSGYGRELENKRLGCPIFKDLYTKLHNTITGLFYIKNQTQFK